MAPLRELGIETITGAEPAVADVVLVGWDDVLTYAGPAGRVRFDLGRGDVARDLHGIGLLGQRRYGARLVGRDRRRHPADHGRTGP